MKTMFRMLALVALTMLFAMPAMATRKGGETHYKLGLESLSTGDTAGAVSHMKEALSALEGSVDADDQLMKDVRYGLGYAQSQAGDISGATSTLEGAAGSDDRAAYLLATIQLKQPGEDSKKAGLSGMANLAKSGGDFSSKAAAAATRMAYNYALILHNVGKTDQAIDVLTSTLTDVGEGKGSDQQESDTAVFAKAYFTLKSGKPGMAIDQLQALHGSNSGYTTSGGTSLSEVLGTALYGQALEHLGGQRDNKALDNFRFAAASGGAAADIHHGKAVAYARQGRADKVAEEVKALFDLDPAYYEKVKK